jgi:hypothetical protein
MIVEQIERQPNAPTDCYACSHSARLHLSDGCAARRCDCWLRRDQVEAIGAGLVASLEAAKQGMGAARL